MKKNLFLLQLLLSLLTCSCAGPHGPFGAINGLGNRSRSPDALKNTTSEKLVIKTYPEYQIHHRPFDLMVEVYDPEGIQDKNFSLDFYYNGTKVESTWEVATMKKIGENHLVAMIKNLKIPAGYANDIDIVYSRHDNNEIAYYKYDSPVCNMHGNRDLFATNEFNVSKNLSNMIKDATTIKDYSAPFLAGIVAQESAFNPLAVSWAKAIGLTQVTSAAEQHILTEDEKARWPSYPGIHKLSYPKLKYLILRGKINHKNEWRLNEKYSLLGGLDYVNYIKSYWELEANQKMLTKQFHKEVPLIDIVLASYNSGPYRVKRAINDLGDDWLRHEELGAARHYVSQVKSYCYEFSKSKGDL